VAVSGKRPARRLDARRVLGKSIKRAEALAESVGCVVQVSELAVRAATSILSWTGFDGGLDLAPVFLESGFWNQAVVVVVDGVGVSEFVFDRVRMPRLLCRRRALWKPSM